MNPVRVLVVDNYDSFVYTIAGYLTQLGAECVVRRNDDGAPHSLAFKDGAKGTDLLLPGAQFTRRFDDAGRYDYVCSVHPYMSGTVVVRHPTATASITRP